MYSYLPLLMSSHFRNDAKKRETHWQLSHLEKRGNERDFHHEKEMIREHDGAT